MTDKACTCGDIPGMACAACSGRESPPAYWCDECKTAVAERRCPLCGLKTKKMK